MGFKVGQKVICVDGSFDTHDEEFRRVFTQLPEEGVVYTIREIDSPSVKLDEISNKPVPMDFGGVTFEEEPGFHERRFKPLEEQVNKMSSAILKGVELEKEDFDYIEVEETELV